MTNPTKIVVLDGYTLAPREAPGEPEWSSLRELGELRVYDRTLPDEIVARVGAASVVFTNKTPLSAATLSQLPHVKYIGVLATGTNVVDLEQAGRQGIVVTNVPGYGSASVAQHVFALLLELTNAVAQHDSAVRAGAWQKSQDFCFTLQPIIQLEGRALGIVGVGAIGQRVAQIAHAMGMSVLAAQRAGSTPKQLPGVPIEWMSYDELFAKADVVTLHCSLTEQTRHLVNAARLVQMKSTSYLINTGRGALVDEEALAAALANGRIAGAGLDVLSIEPPPAEHPLLSAPRCIITPHNAWAGQAARRRLLAIAVENLRSHFRGEKQNVVNAGS